VVSATNKDLDRMIEKALFRKDLYFRLGVIKIKIPSLNERPDDILPLAKHFLSEFNHKFDHSFTGLSPQAENALMAYRWTGNVRELKNMIERATLIGKQSELQIEDLGIESGHKFETPKQTDVELSFPSLNGTGIDLSSVQETLEKHYIIQALEITDGNESKAAKLLKMNHHTFRYRKKKLLPE
jgi:DNA-binding NtrC family response regulator